jgi:pyruvate/2-oxoglutarate dehydrogenase complex dihydrolipoamide acyltransferase (E2) component
MLDEKGVDAGKVKGSGPNGRITKSDVEPTSPVAWMPDAKLMNGWGGTREQTARQDDHAAQEGGRTLGEREEPDRHAHHLQ